MDDRAIKEIQKYQYYPFKIIEDNNKYYCKSYETGTVEGFTKFNNIVMVPEGGDSYKDHKILPSKEIPNLRIQEIESISVGLSFLKR